MKLLESSVYLGPNIYALFPVIRFTLDLGPLEEWPTVKLGTGVTHALVTALPGLREHGCSDGEPGGLLRRRPEQQGTSPGHVLGHAHSAT